ncbi:MAG TPA: putative sulfate exporter family transporter [Jatrophihabitans sp.]|nr:putative sulfate exporter family transporter [Jatrophihabitans sp.]
MDGILRTRPGVDGEPPARARRAVRLVPGVVLATLLAGCATVLGRLVPVLGPAAIGLLLGLVVALSGRLPRSARPGVEGSKTLLLQLAVVALGAQLSLGRIAQIGVSSLPVMLGTMLACAAAAVLLRRWLGIDGELTTLIGVGTAICGASAIAAISPVIRARAHNVGYAVSTVFLFNIAALLAFPPLGHALGLSQHQFGLFAGTAVNDTSSVVATASAYGRSATDYAVVVKLTRTLMIVPIALVFSVRTAGRGGGSLRLRAVRLVPWFLVGFLLLAAVHSAGLLPDPALRLSRTAAGFLITTALTAVGLSLDVRELRRTGARPLLLGLALWVVVASTSLLLQSLAG